MAEISSADIPRNRFQIVGQLGRGALAEVYLCKLRGVAGFEKEVVVKRISAEYAADPLFVRMFLDEARVAARLTHPNIVQVFEVGEEEGVPYIAMEYVRGVTLEMVIRRAHQEGKLHHGHFAQVIAKICDALAYAHSAVDQDGEPVGLVHREVSPANIVLNLDGIPKLLDFGMAAAKDRLLHTQEGMLTGELRYMAPEQVSRGRLDHRADVFSLGITLFELTTGINPFGPPGQRDVEVLQKVLNAPIPRPSQIVPTYPADAGEDRPVGDRAQRRQALSLGPRVPGPARGVRHQEGAPVDAALAGRLDPGAVPRLRRPHPGQRGHRPPRDAHGGRRAGDRLLAARDDLADRGASRRPCPCGRGSSSTLEAGRFRGHRPGAWRRRSGR